MTIDDLISRLENLRLEWPNRWRGLSAVLTDCLACLDHEHLNGAQSLRHSLRYQRLRQAAESMAEQVEAVHKAMAERQCEAAYHNRLHFADTLHAMTALMLASRLDRMMIDQAFVSVSARSEQEMLALLTMVIHDFHHDGRVNNIPMEMETRSVNCADPLLGTFELSTQDRNWITELIKHTDPATIEVNHQAVRDLPFDLSDLRWMQVLVNEADVLTSTLPQFGNSLARALASEWAASHPDMARSVESAAGRLYFLEHIALFRSPGSALLGLQASRHEQINTLSMPRS